MVGGEHMISHATKMHIHSRIRQNTGDRVFNILIYAVLTMVLLIVAYPLIYVLSASFSSPYAVSTGKVMLWPVDFSLEGYIAVFKTPQILPGYRNTIFYTALGTLISVAITMIAAYPLSRKDLPGRNFFMFLFSFTMIFSGGMIPMYIQVRDLGMINTIWAIVLVGSLSVYNMIITRTFIQSSIPGEILEAAHIDGCSDAKYFFSMVLPLSKPVIAVITLFYAVGQWNSFFSAFLYLQNQDLFPLQIVLRDILLANTIDASTINDPELAIAKQGMAELLKYSLIVVSAVPVLCVYPFVQKYFVTGVMIGSIKG